MVVPEATLPVLMPASSNKPVTLEAVLGGVVSTVKLREALAVVASLPAASTALTDRVWLPAPSSVAGVKDQVPLVTGTVPSKVEPSYTFTKAASPVALPDTVGLVSSVELPSVMGPVMMPTSSVKLVLERVELK